MLKNWEFPLKKEKYRNLVKLLKHACQNMVAMETSKLVNERY